MENTNKTGGLLSQQTGRIVKAIAGFYFVEAGSGFSAPGGLRREVYPCKARGVFRKRGQTPLAGDMVRFTPPPTGPLVGEGPRCPVSDDELDTGTVDELLPRKNSFIRPPLANLDALYIVSGYASPAPNALVMDQLTAIAVHKGVEPVLVFNKCDQGDFSAWREIYEKAGFRTYVVSAATGEGLEALAAGLTQGVQVFTGNTGVGKSSLLNRLFPELGLATGAVSAKLGRGRHTTRHVELFPLPGGGYVADTPGFSSLDLEKAERVLKDDLPDAFPEFAPYLDACRFTSCSHTGEKGCAVAEAVAAGEIAASRYESYKALYNEVKDIKDWQLRK